MQGAAHVTGLTAEVHPAGVPGFRLPKVGFCAASLNAQGSLSHSTPLCFLPPLRAQDVATRLFLKRLKRELNIPVMGLVDSDPYGLKILSVYMSGEGNTHHSAIFFFSSVFLLRAQS